MKCRQHEITDKSLMKRQEYHYTCRVFPDIKAKMPSVGNARQKVLIDSTFVTALGQLGVWFR
ncbi:hypothetical protein SAMN05216177_107328 [Ectopseudomonas toyotomiensis]|uniref:Uncharacterized protein n=1 Tax=Ectopseudomonas toyotomiensis TaxID=554344 RepID=A0A1I5VL91_9GAMM|nr:hypothetical protein SAMN05216177_107328 [Pseudomonas toyotomiensis]